jgi:5'-deoxynucleotidase YfbR-like HD superfamily hydrolase
VTIMDIYRSGFVQRYHSNPEMAWTGQTNGQHQWGVAALLCALFPDRINLPLLWEALHHDAGEMLTCDMSHPAKCAYPNVASVLAEAEADARVWMGVSEVMLTAEEADMLKLCDRLESLLFASTRTPWVLTRGQGWPELRQACLDMACALGVRERVEEMVRGVEV